MRNSEFFKTRKMGEGVTLIEGPGRVFCYLVEGEKKALLIDTLCGIGNIANYCKELTSLPITVAVTHGHFDHAAGNFDFEEVFIAPKDVELMYSMSTIEMREEYVRSQQGRFNELMKWRPEDVTPVKAIRCLPIKEGDIFDLGGRVLQVVETPGHTKGSVCFLDRGNRQMFAGDACNCNTIICAFAMSTTVEEYLITLKKLKALQPLFDTFYISHGDNPIDKSCIDDGIECCMEIMAGTDDAVLGLFLNEYSCYHAKARDEFMHRLDGRIGNVVYEKDNIFIKK